MKTVKAWEQTEQLDETLNDEVTATPPIPASGHHGGEGFELRYGTVDEWLNKWLLVYAAPRASKTNRTYWCRQWWKHKEVESRLTALWLAWEHANHEPVEGDPSAFDSLATRSYWWVYHWNHHEPKLFGSESTMTSCREKHQPIAPILETEPRSNLRSMS